VKAEAQFVRPPFAVSAPLTPHGLPTQWIRSAGLLVLLSLTVQHGFPVPVTTRKWFHLLDVLIALSFGADLLLLLFKGHAQARHAIQSRRFEFFLFALFCSLLVSISLLQASALNRMLQFLHLDSTAALTLILIKLFLLLAVCIQSLRAAQRLFVQGVRPELILAGSFATLILIGTLLLLLPNSGAKPDSPIGTIDALFTSISATCVTGLAVRDTGTDFSAFGQAVILALFQVGGLGIITFVAFLSVFSTRALPVPQMVAFRQIINAPAMSDLKREVVGIFLAAGIIELVGVILIYQFLPASHGDPLSRLAWSIFHSVSAFCNAGFALQSDSLEPYHANPGLIFTLMALIVLGGLGFLTISELLAYRFTRTPFFRRIPFFRRLHAGRAPARLTVQTKLALRVTLLLLAAGFVVFWALELKHILRDRPFGESFLIAAFQSVTPRTAGFNTVPIHQLQDGTLVFLIILMVIGASPVSAGGGIKTVSFGILLLSLRAMVTRRERVEVFGRTLPAKTLLAALSVFVLYVLSAVIGIFLLALLDPQLKLQDQAFEVISALSTVGLSTGITAQLSPGSKLVLCVFMFIGRVGPISLVLSVFQSRHTLAFDFPEEEVVVG
jgi:trk system potassium uptake protein TrkH